MTLRDWLRAIWPVDIAASQHFLPVVYVGVVVVVLAVIGSLELEPRAASSFPWLALLAFAIVIASGPAFLAHMPLTLFRYPARLVPFAALATAALAVRGWDRVRRDRRWLDLLLVLIIVADLLPHASELLHTEPFRRHPVPYDAAIGAASKILRFGQVEGVHREAWISGYLNLYDRRLDTFTPAPVVGERYLRYYQELVKAPTYSALADGGIGFTITRLALARPFVPIAREGDIFVFSHGYETPMAAFFWREPLTMRLARWTLDTSHARVTVNAPHDGILVLRQQAAEGWKVTVDGAPAESLVVDRVFRGVRLLKGRHEVVWTYRPRALLIGAVMTLVTLVSLQISIFVKRSDAR